MTAPTKPDSIIGETFRNGDPETLGIIAHGFDWHEELTVISRDPRGYGVTRYIVRNRHGRHGFAY